MAEIEKLTNLPNIYFDPVGITRLYHHEWKTLVFVDLRDIKAVETTIREALNHPIHTEDSWGVQTGDVYDRVFVDSNVNETWKLAVIPPKCKPLVQPCDVYFYRQVKIFIKKLQHCTHLLETHLELTQRQDAIHIHSLLHNQLCASVFNNMILYAWYAAGLTTDEKPKFKNMNDSKSRSQAPTVTLTMKAFIHLLPGVQPVLPNQMTPMCIAAVGFDWFAAAPN
uniref:uncharacterized protein LOC117606358 n=1 Tax=Osmia lignaria TaxID=473952 RepID=UPI0014789A32|nr:uncharacterized protein LOC117606358 [Osmia lignaria]